MEDVRHPRNPSTVLSRGRSETPATASARGSPHPAASACPSASLAPATAAARGSPHPAASASPSASLSPAPSASLAHAPSASLAPAPSAARAPAPLFTPPPRTAYPPLPPPSRAYGAMPRQPPTPLPPRASSAASRSPLPPVPRAAAPVGRVGPARVGLPPPRAVQDPASGCAQGLPHAIASEPLLHSQPMTREDADTPAPGHSGGEESTTELAASQEEFLHQYTLFGQGSMDGTRYFTDMITGGSNSQEEEFAIVNDSISQRPNQKRTKNFSSEEDSLLVSAWLNISLDAIQGTDQARTAYWDRIYEYFHTNRLFDSDRSHKSLNKRWTVIQESVNRFCGCLSRIENRNQSGMTIEDKIVQAGELYKSEDKQKKDFTLIQCWNLLKNQPKWIERRIQMQAPKISNKKQKTTAFSSPAASTPASTPLPHEDESGHANPDYARTSLERPLGRKKEKEKLRQKGERFFYDSLDHLWAKKREDDAEKELKKEERFKQAFALEEERIELEKKKFEFKKMMEEERIMRIDTSGMDSPQRKYYKGLQERIQRDSAS